jgi:hypothetical protein
MTPQKGNRGGRLDYAVLNYNDGMAGRVPAVHVFTRSRIEDVDARLEAGHDAFVEGWL